MNFLINAWNNYKELCFIVLALWILIAVAIGIYAKRKGYSFILFLFFGLIFNVIAFIATLFLPTKNKPESKEETALREAERRKNTWTCPKCKELNELSCEYCVKCGYTMKSTTWRCIKCSRYNPIEINVCADCGFQRSYSPNKVNAWACKKCLSLNDGNTSFCIKCGNPKSEENWICKKCKTSNSASSAFCTNCGRKASKND